MTIIRLATPIVAILLQVSPVAAQAVRVTGTSIALALVTLYQVVVPHPQGYVLMQGMVASTRAAAMVPEFRHNIADIPRGANVPQNGAMITATGDLLPCASPC